MGHRHSKEQLLAAALDAATDEGLSGLTFGRLAKRVGTSDRMLVYYFPTKRDLVREVLEEMGARLQEALATAIPAAAHDHVELAQAAWPVLAQSAVDPTFALFFEALGLAVAGTEPYRTVAGDLLDGWTTWLEGSLLGEPDVRRAEAECAIAVLDGLLLLRQLSGPERAERAAARILGDRAG